MSRRPAPIARRLALGLLVACASLAVPAHHWAEGQTFSQPLNNATSSLAQSHAVGSDTLVLQSGHGSRFGSPSPSSPVRVTVARQSTLIGGQIVAGTARTIFLATARSGDTLSGLTAVEGTSDQAFAKNDPVAALITAGMIADLQAVVSGTATNGVVTTGSYANPAWITSLAASKLSGTVGLANGGTGATAAGAARGALAALSGRGTFSVSTYMTESRQSGTGAGTVDDWPAFKAAVDACMAAHGGTVLVDLPIWFTGATSGSWNSPVLGASNVVFRGRADSAVITVNSPAEVVLNLINFDLAAFVDLVFLGGAVDHDCAQLVVAGGGQTIFDRCRWVNVRATNPILDLSGTTATLRSCRFSGCGTLSGPGMVSCSNNAQLLADDLQCWDYGYARGTNYAGKTSPNQPWIYYKGNAALPVLHGTANGLNLHIRDSIFDEGRSWTVKVERADPAGEPIRAVIVENCSNNIYNGDGTGGGYSFDGVDSVLVNGGDFALNQVTTGVKLRNVRHARIERMANRTGATLAVDADATVTYAELIECPNLTKSVGWAAGRTVVQTNGARTDTGLPSGMLKGTSGAFTAATANTDYAPAASPTFTGTVTTPLTSGSVPYIGTAGVLSQDTTYLTWDPTNIRLRGGPAILGRFGADDTYAQFVHASRLADGTSFALMQSSVGQTIVNSASGQELSLRIGNTVIGQMTSTGMGWGRTPQSRLDVYSFAPGGGLNAQFRGDIQVGSDAIGAGVFLGPPYDLNTGTFIKSTAQNAVAVNGSLAIGTGGGTPILKVLSASATLDFPSIAAGGQQELTISVTGVGVGDVVELARPAALEAGLVVTARVTAANTVTVRASNITGAAIDPASGTYRPAAFKF